MYLVGDGFRVSFKWVAVISTKQEAAHTAKVQKSMLHTLALWGLVTNYGEGGGLQNGRGGGN